MWNVVEGMSARRMEESVASEC